MGVDHTAFAFWGVKLDCSERDQDKIDELIPDALRVGVADWGSRPYGGQWGYVLYLKETYGEIDFDRGVGIRALPNDLHWDRVAAVMRLQDAAYALNKAGIECRLDGESGWLVGGRTW